MATMNVSLPDAMKDWVETQTRTGRYANASDYIRDLVHHDRERQEKIARLKALVDDGLASGIYEGTMEDIMDEARARNGLPPMKAAS